MAVAHNLCLGWKRKKTMKKRLWRRGFKGALWPISYTVEVVVEMGGHFKPPDIYMEPSTSPLAGRNPASANALRLDVYEHDPFGPSKIVRYSVSTVFKRVDKVDKRQAKVDTRSCDVSSLLASPLTHNPAERDPSG